MFGYRNKSASGIIVIDGKETMSTQQCVHCGSHELIVPGSGKKRGYCTFCIGFLCGRKKCMENCVPFEAQLEYQEAMSAERADIVRKLTSRYPGLKRLTF